MSLLNRNNQFSGRILRTTLIILALVGSVVSLCDVSCAWHDQTHIAVAKAAGYDRWYNAAGADIAKERAGDKERYNHYCDLEDNDTVSVNLPIVQSYLTNNPRDKKGHLYGAIISSIREYRQPTPKTKYKEYSLAYLAHYVGDLSQPLHNYKYDEFNQKHHNTNDGIVEQDFDKLAPIIKKYMVPVHFHRENFERDVSREVARVANLSHSLAMRLRKENRDMTREEAYRQLALSASLLQGILNVIAPRGL